MSGEISFDCAGVSIPVYWERGSCSGPPSGRSAQTQAHRPPHAPLIFRLVQVEDLHLCEWRW